MLFAARRQWPGCIIWVGRSSESYKTVSTCVWQRSRLWHRWRPYSLMRFGSVIVFAHFFFRFSSSAPSCHLILCDYVTDWLAAIWISVSDISVSLYVW